MIYPKNISQFNVFYIHFKNIIKVLCVLKENYHVLSEWALGSKKMLTTHWIVFTNTKSSSFSITYLSQQDSIKKLLKTKNYVQNIFSFIGDEVKWPEEPLARSRVPEEPLDCLCL